MIEASGVRRLVEVLRLVPGFQVGYKYNNLPTAAYHGLADEFARRLLLTLSHNALRYNDDGFTSDELVPGVDLTVEFVMEEDRYEADLQYTQYFSERWRTVAGTGSPRIG